MILTCITIFAFTAVVYWAGRNFFFPGSKRGKIQRHLQRKGVEAEALLLNVEQTGLYINTYPQVKLQMQVQPRTGRNFVTEIRDTFPQVDPARLRIGSILRVRYNPADIRELVVLQG